MSDKKYYKTTITIEVLSEYEPVSSDCGLHCIAREINSGGWSGQRTKLVSKELTPKEAADALVAQGSDPSFFQLNEDGTAR